LPAKQLRDEARGLAPKVPVATTGIHHPKKEQEVERPVMSLSDASAREIEIASAMLMRRMVVDEDGGKIRHGRLRRTIEKQSVLKSLLNLSGTHGHGMLVSRKVTERKAAQCTMRREQVRHASRKNEPERKRRLRHLCAEVMPATAASHPLR
jgi:hypothetical protein